MRRLAARSIITSDNNDYKLNRRLKSYSKETFFYESIDLKNSQKRLLKISKINKFYPSRINNEIKSYENLSKIPNYNKYVPTYYESFNDIYNEYRIIVLELVEGENLGSSIGKGDKNLHDRWEIFGKLLHILKFLRDNGFYYDIYFSPNVIINKKDGSLRLTNLEFLYSKSLRPLDLTFFNDTFNDLFRSNKVSAIGHQKADIRTKLDIKDWQFDEFVSELIVQVSHLFQTNFIKLLNNDDKFPYITDFDYNKALEIYNSTIYGIESSDNYKYRIVKLNKSIKEDIGYEYQSIYDINIRSLLKSLGSRRIISTSAVLYIQKLLEPFIKDLVDLTPEGEGMLTDLLKYYRDKLKFINVVDIITENGMEKLERINEIPKIFSRALFVSISTKNGSLRAGLDYIVLEILKGSDHGAYLNRDKQIIIWDVISFIYEDPDFSEFFGVPNFNIQYTSDSGEFTNLDVEMSESLYDDILLPLADKPQLQILLKINDDVIQIKKEEIF